MERISTIQTASVITQPTEAVEHLTLIEKLEEKKSEVWQMMLADDAPFPYHYMAGQFNTIREIIDIVKQHEAESGWISADERLPDKDGKYLVYCVGNRELTKDRKELSVMRFNQKTKGGWFALGPLFKVIYWQPIQPPSEVQDD